jgi:hypothetical protein
METMTTITIPRALLVQALNAIQLPCDRWNGVQSKIVKAAADAVQAELAKPSAPAWHDKPTEPGIWLCDEDGPDCYTWTAHNIVLLNDPALKDDECRWYGPIPQDGAA